MGSISGVEYYIFVHGANGEYGDFSLKISSESQPTTGGGSFEQEVVASLAGLTEPMSASATEIYEDVAEDLLEESLGETAEEVTVTVIDQSVIGGRLLRTGSSRFLQSVLV